MSRILLPLLLSTAAFGTAWWAGSIPATPAATTGKAVAIPTPADGSHPTGPGPALSGLARRSAQLQRTENPDLRSIAALMTEPGLDSSEIFRLAGIWAGQDPDGMWAWLSQGGREKLPNLDLSRQLFGAWFRLDPASAMAAMKTAAPGTKAQAARGILTNLTGKDPSAKQKLIPFLNEVVEACQNGIFFTTKPPETVAELMTLPPGTARDTLLESAGKSWVESDWKAATTWAAGLTEPVRSKLLAQMASTAFRVVPDELRALGGPSSHTEGECFEWAKQWFATEASPEAKRQLGTAFVRKLASTDPAAALEWAQDNLSARPLTQAMGTILKEQAKKDPAAARTLVEGLPPGGMKNRVAFEIAGEPSPETVSWLLKEVDQDPNYQWSQLASNWAFKDPAAYRAYLESAAATELPAGLTEGGLSNLIRKDGPGTMEWAVRTQTPATTSRALQSWTQENPAAAVDWVLQRPPGAARDTSLAAVRQSLDYARIPSSEREALQSRLGKP